VFVRGDGREGSGYGMEKRKKGRALLIEHPAETRKVS